jgi:hypothetical protein
MRAPLAAETSSSIRKRFARVLREILSEGARIEIDGLGTFVSGQNEGIRFVAEKRAQVFVAYVQEDLERVGRLCEALANRGFLPWLDKYKLLPGQNWPRAIEAAIETSDFFIACFSRRSSSKRGSFQCELRFALECAARIPLDEIFFIPVRLDDCLVPQRISKRTQYVDLFPDWERGVEKLSRAMKEQEETRRRKPLLLAG